jgi:hypothetical protein
MAKRYCLNKQQFSFEKKFEQPLFNPKAFPATSNSSFRIFYFFLDLEFRLGLGCCQGNMRQLVMHLLY